MQLPLGIRPFAMAAEDIVAYALNRLADRAFLDVLSSRDKSSMADLIADFFAGNTLTDADSEEEEEPGNSYKTNYIQTALENQLIARDSNELTAGTVSALIMRCSKNNYFCYATQH